MAIIPAKSISWTRKSTGKLARFFHFDDVTVKHRRPIDIDEIHGKESIAVNFFPIGSDDLIPAHQQPAHHRPHEIQGGHLAGALGRSLQNFWDMGDDDCLIGIIRGRQVYFIYRPLSPTAKSVSPMSGASALT
jgi:hypothetical protein